MNPQNIAARLRHVAALIGAIADELDAVVTQPIHNDSNPKRKKKVQNLPPCDIPGLSDEGWAAFVDKQINRTVALRLAAIPDFDQQRKLLALTRKIAAERIAALQERVELEITGSAKESHK